MIEGTTVRVAGLGVELITLSSGPCRAVLTNLGARLVELHVPDGDGTPADVVLARPTLEDMSTDDTYMGATAGRYANRIRDGRLVIDGVPVQLSTNEGANHLHGGLRGFDRHLWSTQLSAGGDAVTFWRVSPDGEEGYPGTLTTSVTYLLVDSTLTVRIRATTDAPTVANVVHHSYFNLGGHGSGTVLDHVLEMRSSFYVPVDDDLLPSGEVLAVDGTPFDFRSPTPIGKNIGAVRRSGAGYDHNWVLDGVGTREVLTVTDPRSGRRLTLATDQPGVQLYAGGHLDGVTAKAPAGEYGAFAGFTLETQTFPDAVNHAHFPSAELHPGRTYVNTMRFEFSSV